MPIYSLLDWVQQAQNRPLFEVWEELYGATFRFTPATVYRYYRWISQLETTAALSQWADAQITIPNVRTARLAFLGEFNATATS